MLVWVAGFHHAPHLPQLLQHLFNTCESEGLESSLDARQIFHEGLEGLGFRHRHLTHARDVRQLSGMRDGLLEVSNLVNQAIFKGIASRPNASTRQFFHALPRQTSSSDTRCVKAS